MDSESWRAVVHHVYIHGLWACTLTAVVVEACAGERPGRTAPARLHPSFVEITETAGVDFQYDNGGGQHRWIAEVMGGGVALFDYDGDGDLDLYFANGHGNLPDPRAPADGPTNRLFRHEADGTFTDVTAPAGLGDRGYGMGVTIGDIDNDGDLDVYVTNLGSDRLYRNEGDGNFTDISQRAGIRVDGWSASACFFDYDRDGYLDLYVTQYLKFDPRRRCRTKKGEREFCSPHEYPPEHDRLLRNNGDATFTDISDAAGIHRHPAAAGLGVVCEDLSGDGLADVFVANDTYPNHLWVNQGDGRFEEQAFENGLAVNGAGIPEAGMGVVAADLTGDAAIDLFLTHLGFETNTLYENLGPHAGFNDSTDLANLGRPSLPYTGFGVAALDIELDGDLDLMVVNGTVRLADAPPGAVPPPPWNRLAEPNLLLLNNGKGRFMPDCAQAAALCGPPEISRGLVAGDLDDDGDLDLVLTNIRGPARIYRNDAPRRGAWLAVRAIDPRFNRDAVGARVTVRTQTATLVRTITHAYSYLCTADARAHFGLGPVSKVDALEVQWPDGLREQFPPPGINASVTIRRETGDPYFGDALLATEADR